VVCPGRTIPEILACVGATPGVRGISGFAGRLSPADVERELLKSQFYGRPAGTIKYSRTGAEFVATAIQAVGIAFTPVAVAPAFGGPAVSLLDTLTGVANLAGSIGQAYQAFQRPRIVAAAPAPMSPMAYTPQPYSPVPGFQQAAFPMLAPLAGSIGRIAGGAIVGGGALAIRGARSVAASAMSYCRRHPGWCASIGGLGAVQALVQGGQLPPIRRRRGRGITPREFRAFGRVHRVLSKFCAGPARGRVRGKPRR
jgi:hypothetical protein